MRPHIEILRDKLSDSIKETAEYLSYKDLAEALSLVIKENYGSHNIEPFIDELKKQLEL